jgi:hypothetical protein
VSVSPDWSHGATPRVLAPARERRSLPWHLGTGCSMGGSKVRRRPARAPPLPVPVPVPAAGAAARGLGGRARDTDTAVGLSQQRGYGSLGRTSWHGRLQTNAGPDSYGCSTPVPAAVPWYLWPEVPLHSCRTPVREPHFLSGLDPARVRSQPESDHAHAAAGPAADRSQTPRARPALRGDEPANGVGPPRGVPSSYPPTPRP